MKDFLKKHFLVFSIILGLSLWSLWPILKDPSRRTADSWDGVLMTWYINETIQKIPNNLSQIFQGNIFYPYKNTMAYSDMQALSALVSYIPVTISGEPIVAISTSLLFGQVATIFIVYLWLYEITKNRIASFLASITLGFSFVRMGFLVHLQMWNQEWSLMSSLLFYKFLKTNKNLFAVFSFLFLGFQMWESPLGVYFGLLLIFLMCVFNIDLVKKKFKTLAFSLFIFFALASLPAYAYLSVSREFNYARSIRDAAHFSLGVDEIIKNVFLKPIFIIFLFSVYFLRKKLKRYKWEFAILFAGLILASGPVLKWAGETVKIFGKIPIPLPYSVFYYLIPGFNAFRTPARWIWILVFGMAFVIAFGISEFLKKKKINVRWKFAILFVIFLMSLYDAKIKNFYIFQNVSEYPEVYTILKDKPQGVLFELPAFTWGAGEIASTETHRMVYSLYHKKYLLGGFSGFNPPSWDEIVRKSLTLFPSPEFDDLLKNSGVSYVLVWKDLYDLGKLNEINNWGQKHLIYEDKSYILFDLNR